MTQKRLSHVGFLYFIVLLFSIIPPLIKKAWFVTSILTAALRKGTVRIYIAS